MELRQLKIPLNEDNQRDYEDLKIQMFHDIYDGIRNPENAASMINKNFEFPENEEITGKNLLLEMYLWKRDKLAMSESPKTFDNFSWFLRKKIYVGKWEQISFYGIPIL